MKITAADIFDHARGECGADRARAVESLLAAEGRSGDAARAQRESFQKLAGLFCRLPVLEPGAEFGRRIEASVEAGAGNARAVVSMVKGLPEIRVSGELLRRTDRSLHAAGSAEDSPLVTALVKILAEGGPDAPERAGKLVAAMPLLDTQRAEIERLLASVKPLAPPDAARSARRISERLRAALAAEPGVGMVLPEIPVPGSLDRRIQASLLAEADSDGAETSTRSGRLFSLAAWRGRDTLPSLSRARGLAAAALMHGAVLAALMFTVSEARVHAALPEIPIGTVGEVSPAEAMPVSDDFDRSPVKHRSVRSTTTPMAMLDEEPVPADEEVRELDENAMLHHTPSDMLTKERAMDPLRESDYGRNPSIAGGRGRLIPADHGDGELLFSWRRGTRGLKGTLYPDDLSLLLRLDEMTAYLRRAQEPDGSFGGGIGTPVPGMDTIGAWDTAARKAENTALAMLALTGDGMGGKFDTPERTVGRAAAWLMAQQNGVGGFVSIERDGVMVPQDTVLTDAICTLALAEAWALDGSPALRDAMRRGLRRLLAAQIGSATGPKPARAGDSGGWAAGLGGEADPVTVAWVVQALLTGKALKWREPGLEGALDSARTWAKGMAASPGGTSPGDFAGVASRPTGDLAVRQTGERAVTAATASLMTVTVLLGVGDEAVLEQQRAFLSRPQSLPSFESFGPPGERYYPSNFTGWGMASLAFHDKGLAANEAAWVKHFGSVVFAPGSLYEHSGRNIGSFAARGEEEQLRGRAFTAAMGALAIENAWRWRLSRAGE